MALSSLSSLTIHSKLTLSSHFNDLPRPTLVTLSSNNITSSLETISEEEEGHWKRRALLVGVGALSGNLVHVKSLFARETPKNFRSYVDKADGYSYYFPDDWRDFDFMAHDSAFKDRYMQLHNVRVRFLPTDKNDVHDLGPMEEVIPELVKTRYAAPNQVPTIYDMKERNIDGKNYYSAEFELRSRSFAVTCFATIAIANGKYYTQIVVANERRWKRYRNQLKVVADSFRVFDV